MAQFQILYSATDSDADWRPLTIEFAFAPDGDQQYLWSTFEEADTARKRLRGRAPDGKFRIALAGADIGDVDWPVREKLRFDDGTYRPTPWHDEPWYQTRHEEHFCHISTEQAGKIAFTENTAKGQLDRQLVMSPGRYLNRFFSAHLDNQAIESWCAKLSVLLQEDLLKITQDAQEIEDVYVGGPASCMAHEACEFDSPCHPTRVYAGPDTALAYIGSREDATARSIIWPGRQIYTSIYGDVSRLRLILEQAGYHEGSLNGARLRRIPHRDEFVVPYIDRGGNLADDGEHLIVGHGEISCDSTNGLADVPWYCPHCSDSASPHAEVFSPGGESEQWCYDCFQNDTTYCEHNERHYSDSETFITVYSDGSSATVLEDDVEDYRAVYLEDRHEWWDRDCCGQCAASGEWFHAKDLTEYQGEWLSEAHLPDPVDDDDPLLLNEHVLERGRFLAEMAIIRAEVAKWEAAGERARIERLRCEAAEAERRRLESLPRDPDRSVDRVCSPAQRGSPLPAPANLHPAFAAAATPVTPYSHTGA